MRLTVDVTDADRRNRFSVRTMPLMTRRPSARSTPRTSVGRVRFDPLPLFITHSIGTRFGTDIDTHSIAYEKVGYKDAQRLSQYTSYSRWRQTEKNKRRRTLDDRGAIARRCRGGVVAQPPETSLVRRASS
jgi:hypothetical protein